MHAQCGLGLPFRLHLCALWILNHKNHQTTRSQGRRRYRYLPPIHVDEIGLTSDKVIT